MFWKKTPKIVEGELLQWLYLAREKDKIGAATDGDLETFANISDLADVQSSRNVILCGWMEGNDNAENNFTLCAPLFRNLEEWSRGNSLFHVEQLGRYYKLEVALPCDLKAIQQNIGCGGGSSNCRKFCVYCGLDNYDRAKPSLIACEDCRRLGKPEVYCFHSVF